MNFRLELLCLCSYILHSWFIFSKHLFETFLFLLNLFCFLQNKECLFAIEFPSSKYLNSLKRVLWPLRDLLLLFRFWFFRINLLDFQFIYWSLASWYLFLLLSILRLNIWQFNWLFCSHWLFQCFVLVFLVVRVHLSFVLTKHRFANCFPFIFVIKFFFFFSKCYV